MTKFVTLVDGIVDVVYLVPPPEGVETVEAPDEVFAGWQFDGVNWTPEVSAAPVPAAISRRQCAAELFARGYVPGAEAVAMSATGAPPAAIEAVFAALPEPEQTHARIDFAATEYRRENQRVPEIVAVFEPGATPAVVDDFFRAAGAR